MTTPITDILTKLDQITQQYTFNGYAALASSLSTSITLALVFYVAFLGWMFLQGWTKFSVGEVVKHVLKIVLAFTLATNWDFFALYIYNVFVNGPGELSSILMSSAGSTSSSVNSALQDSFNQGMTIGDSLWNLSWTGKLTAIVVWVFDFGVSGFCLLGFAVAKVGLAVTLVLAPAFCLFMLWKGTKGIFEKWLMTALGFALTPLFLSAVLLIINALMAMGLDELSTATQSSTGAKIESISTFVLAGIVSLGLLKKAVAIANSIAGGISVSAMGVVNSAGSVALSLTGAKMAGMAAQKALKAYAAKKISGNQSGYFRRGG